jgi:hypothetical protein
MLELIVDKISSEATEKLSRLFRTNVIERWSRQRANNFFDQLCIEIMAEREGIRSDNLLPLLEKMLNDEFSSDLLFEAYRSVSLSRSRDIGPRLIGIITANLALENRSPNHWEESILLAAESLNDSELQGFSSFIETTRKKLADEKNSKVTAISGRVKIEWANESFNEEWAEERISIAPLNFYDSHGSWAVKMSAMDIIRSDLTEHTEFMRGIDGREVYRHVTWWIHTNVNYFRFGNMITRITNTS